MTLLNITDALCGAIAPNVFVFYLLFAGIGAFISLNHSANKRDVETPGTPKQFSYRVLIQDNWQRILKNILLIYVVLRFSKEIAGLEPGYLSSLLIGLGSDRLMKLLKKKQVK